MKAIKRTAEAESQKKFFYVYAIIITLAIVVTILTT